MFGRSDIKNGRVRENGREYNSNIHVKINTF